MRFELADAKDAQKKLRSIALNLLRLDQPNGVARFALCRRRRRPKRVSASRRRRVTRVARKDAHSRVTTGCNAMGFTTITREFQMPSLLGTKRPTEDLNDDFNGSKNYCVSM